MFVTSKGGKTMYSALDLSKYIVTKCSNDGCSISNLQLQKILYYIQKDFLQNKDIVAFNDEIESWQFGPVVPNVYYAFCGFGSMPITSIFDNDISANTEHKNTIDKIVEEKRVLNPWELVEETHKPGGAWDKVYKNGIGCYDVIPVDLIKEVG